MPLIKIQGGNPLLDGRQSENALAIRSGMVRYLSELGMTVLAEFPLANGRRADLLALARTGKFTLVEVKSSIEDFRIDHKWHEYRTFCDHYCFATSANVPAEIFPSDEGLFIADSYGAHPLRHPAENKMASATRKALTLRFARLAALRLDQLSRFSMAAGLHLPEEITEE